MRSMSLVVDLIDLVTKHKSGELRCPATALIDRYYCINSAETSAETKRNMVHYIFYSLITFSYA